MCAVGPVPELAVTDVASSLKFYRDLLGFTVDYERPAEAFACVSLDGNRIMLDQIGIGRTWMTASLEPPLGRGINLQMQVADLDGLLARLNRSGTPLFLPLETASYEVAGEVLHQRQFCVQDPDGYLLRFCDH